MPPLLPSAESQLTALVQIVAAKAALTQGSALAVGFAKSVVDENRGEATDPLDEASLTRDHERRVDGAFTAHSRGLAALGLELSYNPHPTLTAHATDAQVRQGTLTIADENRLCGFLERLTPDHLDAAGRAALADLATDLGRQCFEQLLLARAEDAPTPLVPALRRAGVELARLEIPGGQRLVDSIRHHRSGTYAEFEVARAVLEQTKWGPRRWHADSGAESYQTKWERVLEQLDQVRANPAARELAVEVYQFLHDAAQVARAELEAKLTPPAEAGAGAIPGLSAWAITAIPQLLEILTTVDTELAVRREALGLLEDE